MPDRDDWAAVDAYLGGLLVAPDPALDAALAASAAAGLPAIEVSPAQGKFLHLLARLHGATTILELGTLGGYSTIWLARALPAGGRLVTLEADPHHAEVALANLAHAGLDADVELRVGPALDSLAILEEEGAGPFDLVFVDADKERIPEYHEWALRLTRPGSVIIVDNVVRQGRITDPDDPDPRVRGVRRFLAALGGDDRVDATALQTVGRKGHDGFVLMRVR
jgi:predicted O-methyltransferase YrrM